MKRLFGITLLLYLVCLTAPDAVHGAWIWTPESGQWINPKHAVKDSAEEQFKWAMDFYNAKDYKRAITEFGKLVRFYPNSLHAPQAQYYVGRAYDDTEEYYHAYLAYQKVIEAYPYAKNREEIIKRQYDIGVLFYEGQKAKILGVALLPATDKSIEIFEQVIRSSPYGEYADKAQFKIGEAYKKSGRFAEATIAFQKLVNEYPRSNLLKETNYQIANCAYMASLDASYDQETTNKAIEKFEDFVMASGSKDNDNLFKEADEALKKLKEKKAQSLYETARFYEKTGHRQSAAIYYKDLVNNYPDSSLAKESLVKIMEIEKGLGKKSKER